MKELDRSLGLLAVVAISISAMLGSGIFVLPGLAAAKTGPSVWLAYLLAGLCVLPAALCKSELATAMPASGGSYVYLDRLFGPYVGTIAGVSLWAAMLLKSAFALLGFGAYLRVFVPLSAGAAGEAEVRNYALAMLAVVVAVNVAGVKKVGRAQIVIVGVALAGLALLIGLGLRRFDASRLSPAFPHGADGLLAAAGLVFISYNGVTKVAAIAEEVKKPERNLPLGIMLSLVLVLAIYVGVALALVGIVPLEDLARDIKPIHTLAERLAGGWTGTFAAILGVVTLTSMANAGLLAASRFPFAMSRDKLLPDILRRLHMRFRTPVPAVLLTGGVMALTVKFLAIERVAKLASAIVIVIFVSESIAVIAFRESRAQWYRPRFRAPLYPWLPGAGVVAGLILLVMLGATALLAMVAVAVPGAALYLLYGRKRTERLGVVSKLGRRGDLLRSSSPPPANVHLAPESDHDASVVVALLGTERSPEMLVDVGAALVDGGKLHATHLSEVDEQTEIMEMLEIEDVGVQSLHRRIDAMAEERGLHIEFHAVVSRDLVRSVHAVSSRMQCEWLVMQWHERPRRSITSLSPIGWLINNLQCNLAMYRDAGVRYVRKILALPAPGPNDALVVRTADDLASTWGAQLTLARWVSDADPELTVAAERDYLGQLKHLCETPSETLVLRGKHMPVSVAEASAAYDLLVLGAPNLTLRNLVRRSREDRIAASAACSVLTLKTPRVRTHEAYSRRSRSARPEFRLADYLADDALAARVELGQKTGLFALLGERFGRTLALDPRRVHDAFVDREREQNTAVGGGVALPHATVTEAARAVMGVFTLASPIDYGAPDDEPVQVLFATVCPPTERDTHLRLLSGIARLTLKTDVLAKLQAAASAEEIIQAIRACERELEG